MYYRKAVDFLEKQEKKKKENIKLLMLSLFAAASAQKDNWCNFASHGCSKGQHTLCIYPDGPAKACLAKGILGAGLTDEQKRYIVNMHNQLRLTVANGNETRGTCGPQPGTKSGRMPDLQWDDTLQFIAQRWADQCHFGHDSCRNIPAYPVGQNVAYVPTRSRHVTTMDILNLVSLWYNEVRDFDRNELRRFTVKNLYTIGHYTQLVWAKTTKIGCGLRSYYGGGDFYNHFLVCNYGPSGNVIGQAVYET